MASKHTVDFREKLRAQLRKEVPVSKEQKLSRKIESLSIEAQTLHTVGIELHGKVETFATRASTNLPPSSSPPDRDPLFRAQGDSAPPSQYEAQLKAYHLLLADWKSYKGQVKKHGKRINRFAKSLETAKRKHGSKKGFGETDHHFESLTNALHNLREQKGRIEGAMGEIPLPVSKLGK